LLDNPRTEPVAVLADVRGRNASITVVADAVEELVRSPDSRVSWEFIAAALGGDE
jgi:hypothetical protein